MRVLIIFLAACALTAAMVPMERRAVNTEEEEEELRIQTTTITATQLICAKDTPCGWLLYRPNNVNIIDDTITNSYCKCSADTSCEVNETDHETNTIILKCIKPKKEEGDVES